jgi:hypothetical protein
MSLRRRHASGAVTTGPRTAVILSRTDGRFLAARSQGALSSDRSRAPCATNGPPTRVALALRIWPGAPIPPENPPTRLRGDLQPTTASARVRPQDLDWARASTPQTARRQRVSDATARAPQRTPGTGGIAVHPLLARAYTDARVRRRAGRAVRALRAGTGWSACSNCARKRSAHVNPLEITSRV